MLHKDILTILLLSLYISSTISIKYEKKSKERDNCQFSLPFKNRLSEPFKEGQTTHAYGIIVKNPKRIEFNFHKGRDENADMPLHLSIRWDEGLFSGNIVYNTYKSMNWSKNEERITSPFKANQIFDLRVRIHGGKYQIFGNRREIGVFEQHQPLEGVNHVSITGCLDKLRLFHYGGTIFPNPYNAIAKLTPGKRLDISALLTGKQVNVNLYRTNGEFALQLSIRYNEGAIVRNSMSGGVWGKEEREGGFPLSKGEIFQIFVNGKRFSTFAHRGSPNDIETLEIDGNVDIQTVTINDAISLKEINN